MVGTSISPTSLPKAASLTKALVAPPSSTVKLAELTTIRRVWEEELASTFHGIQPASRIRIDAYRLHRSITGHTESERPFQWTPWTARRRIGLDSVRACIANPRVSPVQATHDTVDRLLRRAEDNGGREDRLVEWLVGLSTGSRAVVEAESVLWATQLLCALDWTQISRPVIGSDRSLGGLGRVILRGRVDVEVRMGTSRHRRPDSLDIGLAETALFVVMAGQHAPSSRLELGLPALTIALDDRHQSVPTTVVGWWPASGRALILPVDVDLLLRTAEAVVEAIRCEIDRLPRRLHRTEKLKPTVDPSVDQRVAS